MQTNSNKNYKTSSLDVLDEIVNVEWIYEKVFWKLLNLLVFDLVIDDSIHILKNIYWFKDCDEIFTRKIERAEFRDLSKIIFKFQENINYAPQ